MGRAHGYIRCSTVHQVDGLGLEAQRAAIEETAKRLGLELVAIHEDAGLSGSLPLADRPGLLDAVASLEDGDRLIVGRRDRLGRDVVNVALAEKEIARRGAKVVSAAGEGSEIEGPAGDLIRTILDAVSTHEKASAQIRTRLALRAKKARGERAGNIPFGFRADHAGKLEPDAREQETLAQVRDLHAQGLSERRIAVELAGRGVVGRTGRALARAQVNRLLARSA